MIVHLKRKIMYSRMLLDVVLNCLSYVYFCLFLEFVVVWILVKINNVLFVFCPQLNYFVFYFVVQNYNVTFYNFFSLTEFFFNFSEFNLEILEIVYRTAIFIFGIFKKDSIDKSIFLFVVVQVLCKIHVLIKHISQICFQITTTVI